jgi:hypothetical protein
MTTAMNTLLVLALVGADNPEPTKAPPKADVRGKVTTLAVLRAKDLVGRIQVDGVKEKDTKYDRAVVTIPIKAKIYRWVDGKKTDAKFSDLKRGAKVQCVFTGAVAESNPVKARASEVLILEVPAKK